MNTKRFIFPSMAAAALAMAVSGGDASAQFVRSPSNPYGQSGGLGIFGSGTSGAYQQSGNWKGFSSATPAMVIGGMRSNPYSSGGNSGFSSNERRGGYMTGGAGSFNPAPINPNPIGAPALIPDAPRKAFDRWVIERDRQGAEGPDALRKQADLRRHLSNPNAADISSGLALNAILEGFTPFAEYLRTATPTPIDESLVKRLNFTRGSGSIGLLRLQGKVEWPALLGKLPQSDDLTAVRQQISLRFRDAFTQIAAGGQIDLDNLKALQKSVESLGEIIAVHSHSLSFAENVEAKRYIQSLDDSVVFLKQPDVGDWLPSRQKPFQSLQDLVVQMLDKKVRFAPAVAGSDATYNTLHRSLSTLYVQAASASKVNR